MQRIAELIVATAIATVPFTAVAGPAEDASAAIDRWVAAYSANDVEAMLKVYAPDAILHGTSEPQLNAGTAALRQYFRGLPGSGNKVTIQERRMVVLSDTAVMGIGFYTFRNPARFTCVVVKRGNEWLSAHHHSSAIPAGRP
jgi:hypothetical protein